MKDDYQALQSDADLASTVKQHEIEMAVAKQLAEFKKEMLVHRFQYISIV
jgi:hypothetical protein